MTLPRVRPSPMIDEPRAARRHPFTGVAHKTQEYDSRTVSTQIPDWLEVGRRITAGRCPDSLGGAPVSPWLSTPKRLEDEQVREELFMAIIEEGGVKPAARKLGLYAPAIFRKANEDAEFRAQLRGAQATNLEQLIDECNDIADKATKDTWAVAKLRIETRMRLAGKLIPAIYGDKPTTEITISNAVGVVCNEQQRQKLIDLRSRISGPAKPGQLTGGAEAHNGPAPVESTPTHAPQPVAIRVNTEWVGDTTTPQQEAEATT